MAERTSRIDDIGGVPPPGRHRQSAARSATGSGTRTFAVGGAGGRVEAWGGDLHRGQAGAVNLSVGGVVSAVVRMEQGKQVEAATVGDEGMIGMTALLGLEFSPFTVIVQVPGEWSRIPARAFSEGIFECERGMDGLVRRYAAFRLRQAGQTIACNAVHWVEGRMCRWMLMAHDRAGRDEFLLTHEFLAEMLGIRRQSVTVTAGIFQRRRASSPTGVGSSMSRTGAAWNARVANATRSRRSLFDRLLGMNGPAVC